VNSKQKSIIHESVGGMKPNVRFPDVYNEITNHHRIIIVYSTNDVNIAIDLYLQYYVVRTFKRLV